MSGFGRVIQLPVDPEPERDPAWADVYARIVPSRDGWIVEFRIDARRSFFHVVGRLDVEGTYLGWTGVLDSFVRAADQLLAADPHTPADQPRGN